MATVNATQPEKPFVPDSKIDDSLDSWNLSAKEWLLKHQKPWNHLVTCCIVFNPLGKVLLIQRASHDTMPNKWEIPGGSVDDEDTTLLTAAARELWEEAGLVATRFIYAASEGPGQEPGQIWTDPGWSSIWCRLTFVAEVEDWEQVRLDPSEHQDFVWATEEEIRMQKIGDREMPVTTDSMSQVLLEAFRLRGLRAEGS